MKYVKKVIRCLNFIEDVAVFIICISLFLVGAYGLYDSYLIYHQANDDSILKYKPGYEGELPNKEIVGNMVGWITIDGTNIDYPIMQGETNYEYLNTNPYGEYSLSGSIFLDSRNSPDFSDEYSLIYGHHMENGYMFGALDEFQNEAYFDEHRKGTLTVGECTYGITIIAAFNTLATDEYIFAPGTKSVEEIWGNISKTEDLCAKEIELNTKGVRLVALSTCKYPDTIDRTIVLGRLDG